MVTFQHPEGLTEVIQVQGTLRCLAPELKKPENQQNKFISKLQTCEKTANLVFCQIACKRSAAASRVSVFFAKQRRITFSSRPEL